MKFEWTYDGWARSRVQFEVEFSMVVRDVEITSIKAVQCQTRLAVESEKKVWMPVAYFSEWHLARHEQRAELAELKAAIEREAAADDRLHLALEAACWDEWNRALDSAAERKAEVAAEKRVAG